MDQNSKQKTLDNLTKAEAILIAVSKNAGFDGLATGLALYLSCQKLGKNVSIVAKDPSVGEAQSLYGVDRIGKTKGAQDLVVVIKNAIENVDKVNHFLDGDDLKLVIKTFPGAKSVTPDQIKLEEIAPNPNLIFAIGYKSQEELKQEITREQNMDPNVWVISLNRENPGQLFAQVNAFSDQAASVCEVTAQVFQQLALPLDEDISYNLYAGIAKATNYFSPAVATPSSFESAAWLLKFGAGKASFAQPSTQPQQVSQPISTPNEPMPQITPQDLIENNLYPHPDPFNQPAIEQVERSKTLGQENWLKPPKVYKGSKSFDREN